MDKQKSEVRNQKSEGDWASFVAMMEPINTECLCIDEPCEDHEDENRRDFSDPSCHSQYCPIYLWAFAEAISKGESTPP